MHVIPIILFLTSIFTTSSCSTPMKSMSLGSVIGASIGLTLGSMNSSCMDQQRCARNGAAVGAALGAFTAHHIHHQPVMSEASAARGGAIGNAHNMAPGSANDGRDSRTSPPLPGLRPAKVRRIWIPDRIEGRQYIRGHEVLVIEDEPTWNLSIGKE